LTSETVADEPTAWERARDLAGTPFDVATGPLVRWTLLAWPNATDDTTEHLLVVVAHHLITDGWSSDLLVGEVVAVHRALTADSEPALPRLTVGYRDFAQWQRARLAGDRLEEHLAFWRERLDGVPALDLPTDRPRPRRQQFAGATVETTIDESTRVALARLGAERGATLHMVLRTAWTWLLAAWSGQERFAVATPVAGRVSPDVEGLVGMFVNTLAIPALVAPDQPFGDAVSEVRDSVLDALAHQELPFELLVADLRIERDVSRSPVAQTLFAVQNFALRDHAASAQADASRSGLSAWWQPVDTGGTRFDLECQVVEVAGGLRSTFTYSTALFEESTIVELAGHWSRALARLAALPGTLPGELGIPLAARVAPSAAPGPEDAPPDDDAAVESEQLVATVWSEVLGVRPGPHDDFFRLGGHSLLATQVSVRVAALLDVEVPVAVLFEEPTLHAYARAVEELVLAEIDALSDEEARELLAADTPTVSDPAEEPVNR
ncbi:condensation domain-containing protein, partial [Nocardioides sp. GXZ039]|uniref:condensation domain-containing protein n=1 Tax=Nocardioides sp. GXZ039 TaxID=3136018 RepID=UPI0030F440D4